MNYIEKQDESLSRVESKRIGYLDIVRTCAIALIVLCHAVELIYQLDITIWQSLSTQSRIFKTVAFTMGRLGVPLFLFITGALILNKNINNDDDCKKFYIKNLVPLILTTEIWIVIYDVFLSIYNKQQLDFVRLLKNMCFLEPVIMQSIWYMPMIIGLYIAMPFVNKIIKGFSTKVLKIPMLLAFISFFILPTVNILLEGFNIDINFANVMDMSFLGGVYGFYVIVGYFIHNKKLKNIKIIYLVITAIISFGLTVLMQIILWNRSVIYEVWYQSAFLFISSVCLFELFTRLNTEKINKKIMNIFTYISKISLAIYFLHIIVEIMLTNTVKKINVSNPLKVIILYALSMIIIMVLIFILKKIKIIKNKVFLIKG